MTDSQFVVNVTTQDFVKVVLEGSSQRPILVDFWANWCAPCRTLGPILDKLAQEWGGRLLVAKVDTDKEKALATQLGIRSLPTVRLFQNGRAIDEFMGAIPESEVRAFLNRHLPKESDDLLRQIENLLAQDRTTQALELVEKARAVEPTNTRTLLAYARVKIAVRDYTTAEQVMDTIPIQEHNISEAKAMRARLNFAKAAAQAPVKSSLEARLAAQPNDSEARYQIATLQVVAGAYQEALDSLLILLRRDRTYGDDAARKGILQIFDLLDNTGELVSSYRGKLTNILF